LYAVLDPKARTLVLSNAGQTEPVLCVPGQPPRHIETDGDRFPLGIVECRYEETRIDLPPSSTVVFYTDGVVEAMNARQEMYSFEDLRTAVAEACMNAIEHGNNSDAGTRVGIRLTAAPDRLQIAVQDGGPGPGEVPTPDIESRMAGKTDTRGWGIFLISNLMDE